jgi:ferric-dicitrate binding protein FerR (iron transport regulator)
VIVVTQPAYKTDVAPGTNKAILTLASGKQIVLDNASKGNLATEGATNIIQLNNGELAYEAGSGGSAGAVAYNTIATPKAGQYVIQLPDGSKVWLNAASSLRFPVVFTGKSRVVEMTGEAYFEIAANARQPFKVKTGQQEIQVLGTHFNISAYADDKTVNTTLLEGSVRVTNGEETQYLNPGQQAQADNRYIALVYKPDIEEVMAWKNGIFRFNESSVEAVMKQLSRWYNVEVVYENNSRSSTQFVGTIPRNVPLSEVLHLLELTGHVQFSIENSSKILVRY